MPKTKTKNKFISLTNKVKLYSDEETKGEQNVHLDLNDNFLSVTHDGYEMLLSIENWRNLNELVNKAVELKNNIKV